MRDCRSIWGESALTEDLNGFAPGQNPASIVRRPQAPPPPPPYLPPTASSQVNPPWATPMRNTCINPSLLAPRSFSSALPLRKREAPSPEAQAQAQQPDAKKQARLVPGRQPEHYEDNDVRAKAPQNWDEVKIIQQVLEPAIRSFARITARTPPNVSLWGSYREQRDAFQAALDRYWRLSKREGPPPELAGIGPWYGRINSIVDAPVVITEADLEWAIHQSVASYKPTPGSVASMERAPNFEHMLQNQHQPSDHVQATGPEHQGTRTSAALPMSFQVDHQVIHEEETTAYRVGALVARGIERATPK